MTALTIKQVALKLFAEKGYEGTALSEVASRTGIKTPSIYAHYKSKEELFLTIYRDVISIEKDAIEKTLQQYAHHSLLEQLKATFFHLTNFEHNVIEKRFFQRAIYYPPDSLKDKMKQDFISYETYSFDLLTEALKKQLDNENTYIWIKTFFCLLDGLLIQHQQYDEIEFEKRRLAAWISLALLIEK